MDRIQVASKRTDAQDSSLTSHQVNNLAPKIQHQKVQDIQLALISNTVNKTEWKF